MRCDLHVHTVHSGMCTVPLVNRICRESYNDPLDLYRRLKTAGMDLVTVTDHDSVGAADKLAQFDDFFLSEEVSIRMPSGTAAHMAVYGITPAQHDELQARRDDLPRLLAYLNENNLIFAINHVFSSLTGRRSRVDYDWFERHFPLWETLNGAMEECSNVAAAGVAASARKGAVAGSDSHCARTLACAYTEVPGARNAQEFLNGLRAGEGRAVGVSGNWWRVTADVMTIATCMMRENPAALVLLPLVAGIPAVTLIHTLLEHRFTARWRRRLAEDRPAYAAPAVSEAA